MSSMHAFRWGKIWLLVGWLMVLAVVILSLLPRTQVSSLHPLSVSSVWAKLFWRGLTLHICAYFGLMLWFCQLYRRDKHFRLVFSFVMLGAVLEFVQGVTGFRSCDSLDLAANGLGVFAAWVVMQTPLATALLRFECLF